MPARSQSPEHRAVLWHAYERGLCTSETKRGVVVLHEFVDTPARLLHRLEPSVPAIERALAKLARAVKVVRRM